MKTMDTKKASRLGRAVNRAYRELHGAQRPEVCAVMLRAILRLTTPPPRPGRPRRATDAPDPVTALWWAVGSANTELVDRTEALHD